ncbi:SLC13 family permease [Youngiibacter multivorans]|uniref:Anion transporter n=1 Tax=Youngiibacter multivorans TaxID=937251 RepID=A0ABS4G6G5_9CLOT|nr:SLC13 family permease [Youngiibacter multivorans]MBP1920137.1 anion transporter [Youngiibacter multivorans]
MTPQIITLLLLAIVVVLLVTEKMPMSCIGLGVIAVLTLTKVLKPAEALAQFASGSIVLISCVFLISGAMMEVGVAQLIGNKVRQIVDKSKGGETMVILLIMAATMAMCTALPRVGVAGALIPIIISISMATGISRTKLLFIMALTASFGGSITLIGTPPNLLAKAALEQAGLGTIGFFDFAVVGIPLAIMGTIFILLVRNSSLIPARFQEEIVDVSKIKEQAKLDPSLKKKQVLTGLVFAVFILSIIFEKQTGIQAYIVGIIGAAVLVTTKTVTEKFAFNQSINWGMTFFIVGMLTLGDAMSKSGASKLLADNVMSMVGSNPSPLLLTGVLFLLAAVLTQFMSNTGAAGMLIPFGISLASGLGLDPKAVIMAIVIGCNSSFMTPMATPANTMIVGPGNIKFMDWVKVGIPLMVMTFILAMVVLPMAFPL